MRKPRKLTPKVVRRGVEITLLLNDDGVTTRKVHVAYHVNGQIVIHEKDNDPESKWKVLSNSIAKILNVGLPGTKPSKLVVNEQSRWNQSRYRYQRNIFDR